MPSILSSWAMAISSAGVFFLSSVRFMEAGCSERQARVRDAPGEGRGCSRIGE